MSGSRADAGTSAGRFRRLAARTLAAATGAIAVSTFSPAFAPALAQDGRVGPPIRLVPTPAPVQPAPSARELTDPLAAPAPSNPILVTPPANPLQGNPPSFDVVPKVAPPSGIQVETLGPLDPDGAGTLEGARGLGGNPWQGIARDAVLRLIADLPVATPSPAVKTLQRRLLLSSGSPQAKPDESAPPRRFGALRVEKLAAMGDPRGAADLAALLPESLTDEAAARALTDAQLLAGPIDCAKATDLGKSFGGKSFGGAYWQRVDLFCRLRGGAGSLDGANADLALDMLREQPGGDDAFLQLAESMAGGPAPQLRGLKDPSPIALAALRATQTGAPPDVLSLTDPARLAAVATNPATDSATRVTAAERAATALFLDARQLAEAYRAVPAKGEELARQDMAARDRSARTRALVHQAFTGAMDGGRRVELARLAVDLVDPALLSGPVGNAAAGLLDTVSPTPDAVALAPAAARLYYALGRADAAKRWHDLALRTSRTTDVARLWPLSVIAGGPPPGGTALGLAGWLDEALRGADSAAKSRVAGQLALLQAVGVPIPEDAWLQATDAAAPPQAMTPNPALWDRLKEAASAGHVGETALTALLLLGEGGAATASPIVTARVVASLRAVGLDAEARAIAREAAAALAG